MSDKSKQNPRTTVIDGQLQIDHDRGVIYFHTSDKNIFKKIGGSCVLRICSLPKPIPSDKQLDITHMYGADWSYE